MNLETRLEKLEKRRGDGSRMIMIQDPTDALGAFYRVDGVECDTRPDVTDNDIVIVNKSNVDWRDL